MTAWLHVPPRWCLGTVIRVVTRRALRLTADDANVFAQAQEWFEQEPRLDMFAIPPGAIDRMRTVTAIAELGIPIYREEHLSIDRGSENLRWVTTALIAPGGPFRYVSAVPAIGFLTALVTACKQAGVPLDSLVVRAHNDTVYATTKVVHAFVRHMAELGLTQLRTDSPCWIDSQNRSLGSRSGSMITPRHNEAAHSIPPLRLRWSCSIRDHTTGHTDLMPNMAEGPGASS